MVRYVAFGLILLALAGCAQKGDIFGDIGTSLASPTAMAFDVAANRLYVVNSNSKVLYDSTEGTFQVYDVTNPRAPVLMSTAQTLSFSGQIYLDTVGKRAYVPNRYTANNDPKTTDLLFTFNIDEAAAGFLSFGKSSLSRDAFAIYCCYPVAANRAWITTRNQELQYVTIGGDLTPASLSLATALDTGGMLANAQVTHIAVIGAQAFLSRDFGGVIVANLDKAGVAGATPVDYFITDVDNPRGIATDGALIYVVGEGDVNGSYTRYLLVINPATLTPRVGNTTTQTVDKDKAGILLATIPVGQSPQEVLLTTQYAFVTNQQDNTVSVISLATRSVVATITVGTEPFSLALYKTLAGVEQYVYVGNIASDTISIIDIPTLTVVATYP